MRRKSEERFNTLSALWIIASIEEDPRIAFADVQYRLDLADDLLLRSVVAERGELFLIGCEARQLEEWKAKVLVSRPHPAWLARREHEGDRADDVLATVSEKDIVCSIFRPGGRQEPSSTEFVEWGLRHIEALRAASHKEGEGRRMLKTGLWAPAISGAVAIAAMLLTAYVQHTASDVQLRQAQYETEFVLRQEAFSGFAAALLEARERALAYDSAGAAQSCLRSLTCAKSIALFLEAEIGQSLLRDAESFSQACAEACALGGGACADGDKLASQLIEGERQLETTAMQELFANWSARPDWH